MIKNVIQLADGTEMSSGSNADRNIRKCTLTQCCNSGDELTVGSVCSACCELTLQAPSYTFRSDDTFTLFRVDDTGTYHKKGCFVVRSAQRIGDQLLKVTAYDNVSKLDIDLTQWLLDNVALLSDPRDFVNAVCAQCGVSFDDTGFNYDSTEHAIHYFEPEKQVTGRILLRWVAEKCGYFCVADAEGYIRFKWYRDARTTDLSDTSHWIRPLGSYKYFNKILPCDGVKITSGGKSVGQYPLRIISNPYIINDNPLFLETRYLASLEILARKLEVLGDLCSGSGGTSSHLCACEVSILSLSVDEIEVGDIVAVDKQLPLQDEMPNYAYMIVMSKTMTGQKCKLKCTGSYRRPVK